MNRENLQKLIDKAGQMALRNIWGDKAYKINIAILKADQSNGAACTRLAKYYRMNGNVEEAKNMYVKALQINPHNQGALNNLNEIEYDQKESREIDRMESIAELNSLGQKSVTKGKYKLACKMFNRAYMMEPSLKHAVNLAVVLQKLDDNVGIEELYKQLLEGAKKESDIDMINDEFRAFRKDIVK